MYRLGHVALLLRWCTASCGAPAAEVQVRVSTQPSQAEIAELPVSVTHVCIGTTLQVETWVTNGGPNPPGITGGTVDITFSASLVEGQSIDRATLFDALTTGAIDNIAGVVDDLGGHTLNAGVAVTPTWGLLGRVSFSAAAEGDARFSISPGAFRFALAGGRPPLEFDSDILFGPPAYVHVGGTGLPGEYDCDDDAALDDYVAFQTCLGGPNTLGNECRIAETDQDGEGDTDLFDFAIFQANFSGSTY